MEEAAESNGGGGSPTKKRGLVTIVKTIPSPDCVLSPEHWNDMTAGQLSKQCKILQIPISGGADEKRIRLRKWYADPSTFMRLEKARKKRKQTTAAKKRKQTTAAKKRKTAAKRAAK